MWYIYLSNKWQLIDSDDLEKAYKEGKEQVSFNIIYMANLNAMMAWSIKDHSKFFPIKRSDGPDSADNSSFSGKSVQDESKAPLFHSTRKKITFSSDGTKDTKANDDADEDDKDPEPAKKVAKLSTDTVKTVKKGKGVIDTGFVTKNGDWKTFHIYCDGDVIYSATLNLAEVDANHNKFYIIQILQSDSNDKKFVFWNRWGRVGANGQSKRVDNLSKSEAIGMFEKKFQEKTLNSWSNKDSFSHVSGKYDLVDINYDDDDDDDDKSSSSGSATTKIDIPPSNLAKNVQELIELIFNISSFNAALEEFNIDPKRMPLGKLSKAQIMHGFKILKDIEDALSSPSSKTHQIISERSSRFYTVIPHAFKHNTAPQKINSLQAVKAKLSILENLLNMEVAGKVISNAETVLENPIDVKYKALNSEIQPLAPSCSEWGIINDCVQNTHGPTHTAYRLSIKHIFKINRNGEEDAFRRNPVKTNRRLLWHGSRTTNFAGIITEGLRIAPPEAPVTGYMFGKGIYFADVCSKSANYCHPSKGQPSGIVLLCEVALGNMYRLRGANDKLDLKKVRDKGFDSTMGEGRTYLDPSCDKQLDDGSIISLGKPKSSGIKDTSLEYNEFIVYSTDQVKIRYIVQLDFHFK